MSNWLWTSFNSSPSRFANVIAADTYIPQVHVLFAQIIVHIEKLLVCESLIDIVVLDGGHSMALAPLREV